LSEFISALREHAFLQNALAAGILASIACGIVGSYVTARRITYIAGGISHCVLGGMGAACYLRTVWGWQWLSVLHGATAAALLAALITGVASLRWRQREDTLISALWAVGMAVGVLFIWLTPGYSQNLMSYLFGNILMVARGDLWLIGGLDAVVVAVGAIYYRELLAICFDDEFARLRGVKVERLYLVLLCLTALSVVLLVTVVGLVMVIALLSLPVAIAGHFTRSLWQEMLLSAGFSALFTTFGLVLSYTLDLPAGATTILLAGAAYLLVVAGMAVKTARKRAHVAPKGEGGSA